MFSVMTSDEM